MTKWINESDHPRAELFRLAAGMPEIRALVEELRFSTKLLRAMVAGMRLQAAAHGEDVAHCVVDDQVAKNNTALAPFDSPAQPTTFGEKSGRYEVEE